MVDHHFDRRSHKWGIPLDAEVPHRAGIAIAVIAVLVAAVAVFLSWFGSGITVRTYTGPQDTPIPMDNPVEPLRSGQAAQDR
jgi:hypothetical protein